jgi:uncharacterized protein (TIGR00730 family)
MSTIRNICVYCGSGPGTDPRFVNAATAFGAILADNDIGLVYGGGSVGLMGAAAAATLAKGGRVTGIIPEFLSNRERPFSDAQELIVTRDMHERKRIMFERSDAFVALPGGVGTLEELVEQLTWAQLGRHKKPILAANIGGFWDPLCALLDHMQRLAFIRPGLSVTLLVADKVEDILPKLFEAAGPLPEAEKLMESGAAERM